MSRHENRCRDMEAVATSKLRSRHEQGLGPGYFLSTAGYIGIRAQLRNPINRKLPRLKTQVAGASEERSGYPRLHFYFSFLFFSFIFFYFPSFFRADCFCSFIFFRLFLGSECYR